VVLKTAFILDFFGISDIGLVREKNEDVWKASPEKGIFILADGMGGHKAGEVASLLSVNALFSFLTNGAPEDLLQTLKRGFEKVNALVYKRSQEDESLLGMGTTLIAFIIAEETGYFAHVGDSRLYLLRNGKLQQLTEDHSLINEYLAQGGSSNNEIPSKHILTKAIGTQNKVEPTFGFCTVNDSDIFLLCSDGLTNFVSREDIEKILYKKMALEEMGNALVELAKINGGGDNITLILIRTSSKKASQ
jgi:PPM family protein phosphatase